jgi:hypothetical protein
MNAGIAQGFIRFGSIGHHVMRYLYDNGPSLAVDIRRSDTHVETVQISATLLRLRRKGYIYIVGRDRKPGQRSHSLYSIEPINKKQLYVPLLTAAEKQKNSRERKKLRVSSVFEFRGQIPL